MKVRADTLKTGDVIMPPSREVNLWMRRHIEEKKLSDAALHLTITDIREGKADKNGRWLVVTASHSAEWLGDTKSYPFGFKVRPETPWPKIEPPQSVIRYVATYINADGARTLMTPAQGRNTYATADEAHAWIDAVTANNSADNVRQLWGDNPQFAVRPCPCYPGHFDPQTVWFD